VYAVVAGEVTRSLTDPPDPEAIGPVTTIVVAVTAVTVKILLFVVVAFPCINTLLPIIIPLALGPETVNVELESLMFEIETGNP
jgi:hypothetical protein